MKHMDYMKIALHEAQIALHENEVPVGAVVVKQGVVLAKAHNRKEAWQDPTAHAELLAIREACRVLGNWRMDGCSLYVTLEPCAMCASAILQARVSTLVYGARDNDRGAIESRGRALFDNVYNHQIEVLSGFAEEESQKILETFFANIRK
ncbi:nucleoside deaminase [Clostridia bacterium]|nr:nucleoside deaminase [Clostridia bacterium]